MKNEFRMICKEVCVPSFEILSHNVPASTEKYHRKCLGVILWAEFKPVTTSI
jgi:hypothetical protein